MKSGQQTVAIALDLETGDTFEARKLLELSEADFTTLRRDSLAARNARKREGKEVGRFKCAACPTPRWLYLSRHVREDGNRWFVHDTAAPDCPWSEGPKLSPGTHRALIYRGLQEGDQHKRLKEFIAQLLEKDPAASAVNCEKVTFSDVVKGEWKRPDVRCDRGGQKLVFELQLNYTFLTEVLKREDFYSRERTFIHWVFRSFDLKKSTVADQAFHALRNVLVLDDAAIARTIEAGKLTFTGYFHRPNVLAGQINDVWDHRFVTLDDLQYPTSTYRAFFFDRDAAVKQAAADAAAWRRSRVEEEWKQGWERFLDAAVEYYDSSYDEGKREDLIDVFNEVSDSPLWHRGLEDMEAPEFIDWHGVLPVLLSIKHDRAIGYEVDTAFRVLEAGLRQRIKGENYGYAILYLWAYKVWRPSSITQRQREWIRNQAARVMESINAGKNTYARHTRFDEAIAALFPELEDHLASEWGLPPPPPAVEGPTHGARI